MPIYDYEYNGKVYSFESDTQPSEQEVMGLIGNYKEPQQGDNFVIEGGVSKNETTYNDRFGNRPNRFVNDLEEYNQNENKSALDTAKLAASGLYNIPTGFVANASKDIGDAVTGLGGLLSKGIYYGIPYTPISGRNVMRAFKGENPLSYYVSDVQENNEFFKNTPEYLKAFGQGLKENYGQGNVDLVNLDNGLKFNFDLPGFVQSFYAHPLNLLDVEAGLSLLGKTKTVGNAAKLGQTSEFSKTVGNKTLSPTYSNNLVTRGLQGLAETKPVQNIVNALDKSPLRPALVDTAADFLGLNPDSRLLGEQGALARQTKLIEQANQVKNITERNNAIAENVKNLSGLSENEARDLINSIESGKEVINFKDTELFKALPEDLKNNVEYLLNSPSIKKITGQEFQKDATPLVDKVTKYYQDNYNSVANNPELGPVILDKTSVKNSLGHGMGSKKAAAYSLVPDVIEKGKIIDKQIKWKGRNYDTFVIAAPVEIADIPHIAEVIVTKSPNRQGFYLHEVSLKTDLGETLKAASNRNSPKSYSIITNKVKEFNPNVANRKIEIRNALKEKVEANAEAYQDMGKLTEETVRQLPINQYAAIKYNKRIDELTDTEKLDALNDINKLPESQKPFYIPHMYEDKLRAGDFFADGTKRYKPNELKQRRNGLKEEGRVYDPVELANRLDAHRIKMINTENLINEITDNFAKPYNRKTDELLDGYVEFNPDAILKFYKGSIDLNQATLAKLEELGNIDDALKFALEESVKKLPEDTKEWLAVARNNNVYQIPKTVAETLKFGKNKKGVFESLYDMGTAGFKRKVLGLSPKWFINNRIGNAVMAGLKGTNATDYIKALNISEDLLPEALKTKSMYEAEKTIIGRTGGGNKGAFGNVSRFLGGEFIDTKDLKGLDKVKIQLANSLAIPGKTMNAITDAMFKFNQKFEDVERRATYIHSVNKVGKNTAVDNLSKTIMKTTGQNIVKQDELLKATLDNPEVLGQVMKNVDNTLGDYINMTATERRTIRKIVPFYSWLRTISRYTLSLAEESPIKADIMSKVLEVNDLDNEDLPEYQKAAVKTNMTSDIDNRNLVLNYGHSNPLSTFGEFGDNPISVLNPLLTQPLEAMTSASNQFTGDYTSPSYENQFGGGYVSLLPENKGELLRELPTGSKLGAATMNLLRTSTPGLDWLERVGVGSIDNLINKGELKPYDRLWNTAPLGYNFEDLGRKKPTGWTNSEQIMKWLLPVQKQGKPVEYRKIKRKNK